MNLFEVNFASTELGHRTSLNVLMPTLEDIAGTTQNTKTLFLLHGFSDDHSGWLRRTKVEYYAREYNLAVVMPNAQNSFYTNMRHGFNFLDHIALEVPTFIQKTFHLSAKRENNFVAGLSMGGYGAFKIALSYPERFAAAASLSGVLDIQLAVEKNKEDPDPRFPLPMGLAFGNPINVTDTPDDIPWLLKKINNQKTKPRLYQCCGTEDDLYANNLRIRELIQTLDFDYTYEESAGDHNWVYWDTYIKNVLNWLPLEQFE